MRKIFIGCFLLCIYSFTKAQSDSTAIKGIFDKITSEVNNYRIDTSAAPDDKITKKIIQLRQLRGGFNVNEAIHFKMEEDEKKKEISETTMAYLKDQFTNGKGKQWLDNAVIHIYRQHFSYKELKQMVKFYKTSAGQKLATDFPYIMMTSLMAAQIIHDELMKEMKR